MAIVIALGSNRAHGRHGAPRRVVAAALRALADAGIAVERRSRIHTTAPLGPSQRRYANAVAAVATDLPPGALLGLLHDIEDDFGRRRQRRWGARVLDLDLIAYHDRVRGGPGLYLPHPAMHLRRFVLAPMMEVAPTWRHPILGLTVRQMYARLTARR
ncbi:2-amino-4-hydroxy-6-hydroxymethyldihydropteridine diphosphokinase [Pacificimonas sp. WHA3]|uniref:2-amino-4-hydroxy-6-hydroxymethyldihydropteridine pyrophosphokinase n=1 Tax=Pacificimonas pallii TaxID=2827236 RepID=A0ABS6SG41_9SPHN|nr:2-amino-4-hydroxy-6-hydroxymethyldihydropteridine diphosphokinase [Pacificimonas pallii]MBV7256846.1 2-amino-4-hydroxy-6-hydroxymethyldihydropteridine diphosphokinase [Pacificimonas pallii]